MTSLQRLTIGYIPENCNSEWIAPAPDVHAALNMAKSQYGDGNVLGAPMLVRS